MNIHKWHRLLFVIAFCCVCSSGGLSCHSPSTTTAIAEPMHVERVLAVRCMSDITSSGACASDVIAFRDASSRHAWTYINVLTGQQWCVTLPSDLAQCQFPAGDVSPCGTLALLGSDGGVAIAINLTEHRDNAREWSAHSGVPIIGAWITAGGFVSVGRGDSIKTWDGSTLDLVGALPLPSNARSASISADRRRIAVCTVSVVHVYTLAPLRLISSIEVGVPIAAMALSYDGERLASASRASHGMTGSIGTKSSDISIWDVRSATCIAQLPGKAPTGPNADSVEWIGFLSCTHDELCVAGSAEVRVVSGANAIIVRSFVDNDMAQWGFGSACIVGQDVLAVPGPAGIGLLRLKDH